MKRQEPKPSARPYRVFFDVLEIKGWSWAPRLRTRKVVDLGLSDDRAAALTGGADRDRLVIADDWVLIRRPILAAASAVVAAASWLSAAQFPWLAAACTLPLMVMLLAHTAACRYLGTRAPALALAGDVALADGTMAVVPVNDISGMDLRRIARALTTLQERDGTRHDADALAAVEAVLARDRPAAAAEPVPDPAAYDPMEAMFDSIVTTMTARTPAQRIAELEDMAARR